MFLREFAALKGYLQVIILTVSWSMSSENPQNPYGSCLSLMYLKQNNMILIEFFATSTDE
jgi:hypothetical protein